MVEVYPISIPQIEWKVIRSVGQTLLERNPTKILDEANIKIDQKPATFIAALGGIHDPEAKFQPMLRRSDLLAHLSFGVMIIGDWRVLMDFIIQTRIPTVQASNETFLIATASLEQWRLFCIMSHPKTLEISNKIQILLESAGLRDLFYGYSKKSLNNGLFTLCQQSS